MRNYFYKFIFIGLLAFIQPATAENLNTWVDAFVQGQPLKITSDGMQCDLLDLYPGGATELVISYSCPSLQGARLGDVRIQAPTSKVFRGQYLIYSDEGIFGGVLGVDVMADKIRMLAPGETLELSMSE